MYGVLPQEHASAKAPDFDTRTMQLTRFTDYALRVLIFLSYRKDELATINEIAESYAISEHHLTKIVHQLARLGYVTTVRGKGGGLKLARPPEQINLGEVVRHTEETLHVVECLEEGYQGTCRLFSNCALRGVLREAQEAFLDRLDQCTVKDLLQKRTPFAKISMPQRRPRRAS